MTGVIGTTPPPCDSRTVARIPLNPVHPERICWGCDKYCAADDLGCANGTVRTMHPCELFGPDWFDWLNERDADERSDAAVRGGLASCSDGELG
jgi:hypothetical protein